MLLHAANAITLRKGAWTVGFIAYSIVNGIDR
jgi:hypothetical protein